jgi:hypothetical protein
MLANDTLCVPQPLELELAVELVLLAVELALLAVELAEVDELLAVELVLLAVELALLAVELAEVDELLAVELALLAVELAEVAPPVEPELPAELEPPVEPLVCPPDPLAAVPPLPAAPLPLLPQPAPSNTRDALMMVRMGRRPIMSLLQRLHGGVDRLHRVRPRGKIRKEVHPRPTPRATARLSSPPWASCCGSSTRSFTTPPRGCWPSASAPRWSWCSCSSCPGHSAAPCTSLPSSSGSI